MQTLIDKLTIVIQVSTIFFLYKKQAFWNKTKQTKKIYKKNILITVLISGVSFAFIR